MSISKNQDVKLKLGNLVLAILFSVVPTSMTIGFLGTHGYILCKNLDSRLENIDKASVYELCNKTNLEANFDYVIWIWLFTTIPTWRWFYIGHYRRVARSIKNTAEN